MNTKHPGPHTPTPYHVETDQRASLGFQVAIKTKDAGTPTIALAVLPGAGLSQGETPLARAQANAEFICKACNSHEAPGVCRYLDITTAHMTQEDADRLHSFALTSYGGGQCAMSEMGIIADIHRGGGHWIHVDHDGDRSGDLRRAGFSEAFVKVMAYAHDLGCNWVLFDRDAQQIEGLETFNW